MPIDDQAFQPLPAHYEMCFGCGTEHPTGLHLRMEGAERRVRGTFEVTEHHQGAPGLAHGGVLAAAVDEGMGFLLHVLAVPAVTGHLEIDFRRPVPVGSVLELAGEVEDVEGRKIRTRMTGSLDGEVAIEARALYIRVDPEHFTEHGTREPPAFERPYNP